jgi:hypothetical protein
MMNQALDKLCADLGSADHLRAAFAAFADANAADPNARALMAAVAWICDQPGRTPIEKLGAIRTLMELPPGFVYIPSLREFCGWKS